MKTPLWKFVPFQMLLFVIGIISIPVIALILLVNSLFIRNTGIAGK
jgi:hypothetical protein